MRTAITLRAAHAGEANPSEQFVADLYAELADQAKTRVAPDAHQITVRRGRLALAAIAAGVAVAGGTAIVTDAFNHAAVAPSVAQAFLTARFLFQWAIAKSAQARVSPLGKKRKGPAWFGQAGPPERVPSTRKQQ